MKLPDVNCRYGAPMGRRSHITTEPLKVRLGRVYLNSGGYDNGGAYWGIGTPLFRCYADGYESFTRARDRDAAKAEFLKENPALRFYR